MLRHLLLAGLVALSSGLASVAAKADGVQVFARDGAAVTFPEGTLAAFDLAIAQGADGLRVDVYQTADGVQVIRTARNLAENTDAAALLPAPAPLKGEPAPVGRPIDLTFYSDYARLTATQPIAGRGTRFDGMFPAPILEDLLVLVERRKMERRRRISLLIVLHDTAIHAARGRPMEPRLLATLQKYRLTGSPDVMIGTSEPSSFARLGATGGNPRVFVLGPSTGRPGDAAQTGDRRTFGDYQTPDGLRAVRNFADAVLVDVQDVQGTYADGGAMPASTIVDDARGAGLRLFVGGFADAEDPVKPRREAIAMYRRIIDLGVDAIVTDEPARATAARRGGR
ncbi:glycerophosphodiester phosphodiesterase family protein [Zavarzinia sp.]|uniref:glycerophosphodiester phosphodiesterase family protein n=1 Tax=Zavarzinia sp. TaxID=2027920 RepID=UPI003BB79CA3